MTIYSREQQQCHARESVDPKKLCDEEFFTTQKTEIVLRQNPLISVFLFDMLDSQGLAETTPLHNVTRSSAVADKPHDN